MAVSVDDNMDQLSGPRKRTRKVRPYPAYTLEDTLAIATRIQEANAGLAFDRSLLAGALGTTPASSGYTMRLNASSKYGLTQGGYNDGAAAPLLERDRAGALELVTGADALPANDAKIHVVVDERVPRLEGDAAVLVRQRHLVDLDVVGHVLELTALVLGTDHAAVGH